MKTLAVILWKPLPYSSIPSPSPVQISILARSSLTCCSIRFFLTTIRISQWVQVLQHLHFFPDQKPHAQIPQISLPHTLVANPDSFHFSSQFLIQDKPTLKLQRRRRKAVRGSNSPPANSRGSSTRNTGEVSAELSPHDPGCRWSGCWRAVMAHSNSWWGSQCPLLQSTPFAPVHSWVRICCLFQSQSELKNGKKTC